MAEKLTKLGIEATLVGLKLPEEFVFFMSDQKLQDEIPSNTACYFKLSENIIPSPLAKGDYFIQFLNDQQDVVFWYLYLRTDGEHSVVATPIPLFDIEVLKDITVEILLKEVVHCSDSFKEFIYRYWIENRIWFGLEEGDEMTDEMEQYIAHFK